jgi:UDP-N-acetylmuramoylalanine--D-glutamate ligase
MKRQWMDSKITILGFSLSGISSAKYLANKGAVCTISENKEEKPEDVEKIKELQQLGIKIEMGGHKNETVLNADMIVASPGIPPHSDVIKLANDNNIKVISEIELAYIESDKPFIAITGTNGKTTTTKLVSEILTNSGLNAPACGNIGLPPITLVDSHIDYFVAELSSFQIYTSKTFKPQIALFINYAPDHIDWHGSEEAYYEAKASLFTGYKSPAWSILNACDPKVMEIKNHTESNIVYFGREMPTTSVYIQKDTIVYKNKGRIEKIISLKDISLIGKHNYQNIMASIAIAKTVGVDTEVIRSTIAAFIPPEHRLEYVDTIDGIEFYNDSKATNCDSAICAMNAFEDKQVVLIAGGKDKGTDLCEFVETVKKQASSVVLIGEAADRFQDSLESFGFSNIYRAETLEKAIDIAFDLKSGPVLLSPACASFDMYKNYEERGRAFKDYVIKKKTLSPA